MPALRNCGAFVVKRPDGCASVTAATRIRDSVAASCSVRSRASSLSFNVSVDKGRMINNGLLHHAPMPCAELVPLSPLCVKAPLSLRARTRSLVADGASPKADRYVEAKRPRWVKPQRVAMSATVATPSAFRSPSRAALRRRRSRYASGERPTNFRNCFRRVRSGVAQAIASPASVTFRRCCRAYRRERGVHGVATRPGRSDRSAGPERFGPSTRIPPVDEPAADGIPDILDLWVSHDYPITARLSGCGLLRKIAHKVARAANTVRFKVVLGATGPAARGVDAGNCCLHGEPTGTR